VQALPSEEAVRRRRDRARGVFVTLAVVGWSALALLREVGDAYAGVAASPARAIAGLVLTGALALAVAGQPTR